MSLRHINTRQFTYTHSLLNTSTMAVFLAVLLRHEIAAFGQMASLSRCKIQADLPPSASFSCVALLQCFGSRSASIEPPSPLGASEYMHRSRSSLESIVKYQEVHSRKTFSAISAISATSHSYSAADYSPNIGTAHNITSGSAVKLGELHHEAPTENTA